MARERKEQREKGMNKSGIHIKESHKGLFTAKAKRAGMGVQAYAHKVMRAPEGHYDSATRKQASFAITAKTKFSK